MLNVIVEDVLSETVMRRLLEQVGFQGESTFRMMRGNGKIRQGCRNLLWPRADFSRTSF